MQPKALEMWKIATKEAHKHPCDYLFSYTNLFIYSINKS